MSLIASPIRFVSVVYTDLTDFIKYEISKFIDVIVSQYEKPLNMSLSKTECGYAFGAGDSLAAALAAQYLSSLRFLAIDPLSLVIYISRSCAGRKSALAISYKGKTREVVKSAERLRSFGWRVVAITSNPRSPLALAASDVVEVINTDEKLPIGVSSFVATITAIAKLIGAEVSIDILKSQLNNILAREIKVRGLPSTRGINEVIAVGEGSGLVPAYFLCLKLHEVLCMPCRVYPLEEFLHAPIYSISRSALTVVYPSERTNKASSLISILSKLGVPYVMVKHESTCYANIISGIIQGLKLLLKLVAEFNVKTPCYRDKKVLINISTPLIYFT